MDIFIAHASEDKDEIVRPLAAELRSHGLEIWYDEDTFQLGDSIRKKIDHGLSECRFGLVILSPSFFSKQWPQLELDALTTKEVNKGTKVILPIWHNVTRQDVERYSPTLAGRFGVSTSKGIKAMVEQILAVLNEPVMEISRPYKNSNRPLSGATDLVNWCLTRIFEDQFDSGDARGAWSKKYPDYLKFLYGEAGLPGDISIRDTITFSAWIASALHNYSRETSEPGISFLISSKLQQLRNYLDRHYDSEIGGFGLTSRPKSRTPFSIEVDLRHTCWAMSILWELGLGDTATDEMLKRAGSYVEAKFRLMHPETERAITYAVIHRLLSTDGLWRTVLVSDRRRRESLNRIEGVIIEKFDLSHGSWDLDSLPAERASIENALFILYTMSLSSCLNKECTNTLQSALSRVCSRLIKVNRVASALPFYENGFPDIGASLMLLYILNRDQIFIPSLFQHADLLSKFVKTKNSRLSSDKFAYPWHLAMALLLS